MKKTIAFILLIGLINTAWAHQLPLNPKLRIQINKNVELLGLAYFVGFEGVDIETKTIDIKGKKMPKKDWHNYGYFIYEKYKQFATNESLLNSFTVADHLWLDYLIALLVQVEDFPNASLTEAIPEQYYINFSKTKNLKEAKENATIFLGGLNSFYTQINFNQYLLDSKKYYDQALEEVKQGLPKTDFISTMEGFYKKSFDTYTLLPSLTIPKGMGFGVQYTSGGNTHIFNVFGALDFQQFLNVNQLQMGFTDKQRLRELSVHEFGHSFVNPSVDKLPEKMITDTEHLLEPMRLAMANQGYNTWRASLYEHFVRAGEIIIAEKIGDKAGSENLFKYYLEERQFKYIPSILIELRKYDSGQYKTYDKTVLAAMKEIEKNK
ncbi:DUF4932 domain-containing protein [Emticicia sp. BO119]|uniref:DUF4932 domain-containing protein n=1 Tax=Emticicia sp. BO119 TaxID=2757768 RepID=UPI0015F06601|nr:DUF4932 domain-containing protein [Emticicia sp. BO119]MBA4852982.1 DUF4932 domain-containing protein [Emticicia sp. BO119]